MHMRRVSGMARIRPFAIFFSMLALAILYFTPALPGLYEASLWIDRSNTEEINRNDYSVKVLLIAYGRSGSSLAGELLSLTPGTRYYFEPLFFLKDVLLKDLRQEFSQLSVYLLDSLFNCSMHAVNMLLPISLRNPPWKMTYFNHPPCNDSDRPQVAKVIRVRLDHDTLAWLRSRDDIKVVHWVRDPRGMLNSLRIAPLTDDFVKDSWQLCDQIGHDILAIDSLPSNRWRRVSYEELVSNPVEVMRNLYRFMGIPWPSDGDDRVLAHFAEEPKTMQPSNKYYSTYRNLSVFDLHHWKRDLSERETNLIERECGAVMDALGYQRAMVTGAMVTGPLRVDEIEKRLKSVTKKLAAKLLRSGAMPAPPIRLGRTI